MNQKGSEHFYENTCFMPKYKVTSLLELVVNNCAFSFQGKVNQHLKRAAVGSPVSSGIANSYMEYFKI